MKKLGKKLTGSQSTIESYASCGVCNHCGCGVCGNDVLAYYNFDNSHNAAYNSNQY